MLSCLSMPTKKHGCVLTNFSVFTHVAKLETIFHLQNTQQHHQMSHPFHLLSLLTVTPASRPCLMDFQTQVDDFFQDLTGIFLCVYRWRSGTEWFSGDVLRKDSAYRVEMFFLNLFEKAKCDTSCTHFHIWPNKGSESNYEKHSHMRFLMFVLVYSYLQQSSCIKAVSQWTRR